MSGDGFQSTRPIRGATCKGWCSPAAPNQISIHAPHTGRDCAASSSYSARVIISIHAPHTGRDRSLPLLPVRPLCYFNPRAPYGARPSCTSPERRQPHISIHAPHTGRDAGAGDLGGVESLFQSTRPIRGATAAGAVLVQRGRISIHAPHTGRDVLRQHGDGQLVAISIHAPHTGRDARVVAVVADPDLFQSTRPIRGATVKAAGQIAKLMQFQSTRPIRGATDGQSQRPGAVEISIHAPHTGRD